METDRLSYLLRHEATAHGKEDYKHLAADALESLSAEVESLRAELAEVRRDAERYRWLRSDDCPFSCYEQEGPDNWGWCPTSSRDLDEAIDAAMAGDSAPESAATATRLWGGDAK